MGREERVGEEGEGEDWGGIDIPHLWISMELPHH